jgi:hypothetical protein
MPPRCSVDLTPRTALPVLDDRSASVTRASFLSTALWELSVALVQSQGYVYHS